MIEILVVVAIIALLTTIGLLSFTQVNKKARDGKRKSDLEQVRSALVLYRTDNSVYPTSLNWSTMSPIASYLSGSSIRDPLNSPNPQYVFLGTTTTFTICAALESTTPASYCLTQP